MIIGYIKKKKTTFQREGSTHQPLKSTEMLQIPLPTEKFRGPQPMIFIIIPTFKRKVLSKKSTFKKKKKENVLHSTQISYTHNMVTFSKQISVIALSTIATSVSKTSAPILNKQNTAQRCESGESQRNALLAYYTSQY